MSGIIDLATKIGELTERMTLEEKIGQLRVVASTGPTVVSDLRGAIAEGGVGGVINEVDVDRVNELQRIAVAESRLGIPLLIGRDVIHGFRTIFPIPLGQAATWNPELIQSCARAAAIEATAAGVNWTFAPMMDICRDPRWGRIAETLGEDPYLTSVLAQAMICGFQGVNLSDADSLAACAKHFAGYGASEGGRDYNTTNLSLRELRNVHLPPFKAAVDAGVASVMTSFSDIDGVPATANEFLLRQVLRLEWQFRGLVVSDWNAVFELATHGLTGSDKESAYEAASAGIDMEMTSDCFRDHLPALIREGRISMDQVDRMVANVLQMKFRLGLFDRWHTEPGRLNAKTAQVAMNCAREAARQSIVLLKNEGNVLPLNADTVKSIAVIGPLADDAYEQLGTWIFDGDPSLSKTPLRTLREFLPDSVELRYVRGLDSTRSRSQQGFHEAVSAAERSDVVLLFLGEEAILTGEAHCRADIRLPGAQEELIDAVAKLGKPIVLVLLTGRPLALAAVVDKVQAILCAWHPGTMAGPAIVDLLFGVESPSGKLPVSFPRITGQVPIYYSHKNTGRPGTPESVVFIEDIEIRAPQHSFGNTCYHLDVQNSPLFPFGFGLSYTKFVYSNLVLSRSRILLGTFLTVTVDVENIGPREAFETVQLYIRDIAGSVTRPVKELKRFAKIRLSPGEKTTVKLTLSTDDLGFYGRDYKFAAEPGVFHLWVGGSSEANLRAEFEIE